MNIDWWKILVIFFMTMGIIAVIGALLSQTAIHQTGIPYLTEYSSPIFAFIGATIGLGLWNKSTKGKWEFSDVLSIFIVGIMIIVLYMAIPEYLPSSYAVLRWEHTPILP